MIMEAIDLLIAIAEEVGIFGEVEITTLDFADKLVVSQQTISNALRSVEKSGYIKRKSRTTGIIVSFTESGRRLLNDYKNRIIKVTKGLDSIDGTLYTGLGEGRFYTEIPGYKLQFRQKLKITPYPGTLNIRVDHVEKKQFLLGRKYVLIDGFKTSQRTYGSIKCYPAKIKRIKTAIIVPERTIHKNTFELISSRNLRHALNLTDGDKVKVKW